MHTLSETIEIAGEWWLPDKPKEVVSGILHFSPLGIVLHLNQAFAPLSGAIRPGDQNPKYAAVHGITVKGEAVTLFNAQQLDTSIHFGSGGLKQPGRTYARVLAFGAHLPANFQFKKVSFRVPGLEIWLGEQIISHKIEFVNENKLTVMSYTLDRMPDETFHLGSIDADLSWYYGWSSKVDPYKSIRVDISACFSFQPKTEKTIDWFLKHYNTLITMLSLLSGHPLVTDAIQAKLDDSHQVDILVITSKAEQSEHNHPKDFFLSRPTISAPLEMYCNQWFGLATKVDKPVSLARSVLASEKLWLHVEFLSLMQSLEGLHRSLYDGSYMAESEYEQVKSALIKAIPGTVQRDHKDALKSRIRYGNQISLRKRLAELADILSPESRANIFGGDGCVPGSWIDTRNYYTHWDHELLPNVLDDQSMYYANVRMRHFIRVLYACLMGISNEDIIMAFQGISRIAQQLAHINIVEKRQADPSYVPQAIMTISSGNADEAQTSDEAPDLSNDSTPS